MEERALALMPLTLTEPEQALDSSADAVMAKLGLFDVDLLSMKPEQLLNVDTRTQARLAYISGLIRLANFLRVKPNDFNQAKEQTQIALGYIRHVEGNKLAILNMGERAGDKKLAEDVAAMRKNIAKLAEAKANIMEKRNAKKDIGPQE